jgi:hypothetical protein
MFLLVDKTSSLLIMLSSCDNQEGIYRVTK